MPAFDKTGPIGTGPTGRGLGPCGGGSAWRGRGRGYFRRRGGFGMGRGEVPFPDQKDDLQRQQSWLQTQLNAINQRLRDMED